MCCSRQQRAVRFLERLAPLGPLESPRARQRLAVMNPPLLSPCSGKLLASGEGDLYHVVKPPLRCARSGSAPAGRLTQGTPTPWPCKFIVRTAIPRTPFLRNKTARRSNARNATPFSSPVPQPA